MSLARVANRGCGNSDSPAQQGHSRSTPRSTHNVHRWIRAQRSRGIARYGPPGARSGVACVFGSGTRGPAEELSSANGRLPTATVPSGPDKRRIEPAMSPQPCPAVSPAHVVSLVRGSGLLSQIVEVSGDAIFSEDMAGTITSWNAAAERIYGCAARDMVGSATADLLPEGTSVQLKSVHRVALSVRPGSQLLPVQTGRYRPVHSRRTGRRCHVSNRSTRSQQSIDDFWLGLVRLPK